MESFIETRSLTRLYGAVIGVNDVSLRLEPGLHGLLGPNGAGKSTLLKLITGQIRPSEGEVRVLGQDPWNNPALFRQLGFCPEQDSLHEFLSGFEFVELLARVGGLRRGQARDQSVAALEQVGATQFIHRKIGGYSHGMRQRVKLAQALVHEPRVLILDEPLSGLDPVGRREIIDLVIRFGREGRSVVVSSHVLYEVQSMTRQFLLIYGGRVLAAGDVGEIRALMDKFPHRVTLRTSGARELARRMLADLPISGLEIDEGRKELIVLTKDPKSFYAGLPGLAVDCGARIDSMVTGDDSLDAVFHYLVEAI